MPFIISCYRDPLARWVKLVGRGRPPYAFSTAELKHCGGTVSSAPFKADPLGPLSKAFSYSSRKENQALSMIFLTASLALPTAP